MFLVLSGGGLYVASDYMQRKDMDLLTARVGNHSGRIAVALGRHQGDTLKLIGNDILGSLLADPAIACAELRQSGSQTPVLTTPRYIGCKNQQGLDMLSLPAGRSGKTLAVYFSTQEISKAVQTNRLVMLLIMFGALAVASIAGAFGFHQTVGRPLRNLRAAISKSSETGEPVFAPTRKRDELGVVIAAYNNLQAGLKEARQTMQDKVAQRVSEEQRASHAERIATGLQDFQRDTVDMVSQLHANIGQITCVSSALDEAATGVTNAIRSLEKEGQKSADESSSVAASFADLATQISGMASRVRETLKAGTAVQESGAAVNLRLSELTRSIDCIAESATLIEKIAQQTNLLALNATIEAARAGDAGLGFAVVANEVKTLSATTAQAAITINQAIGQIAVELAQTREAVQQFDFASEIIADASAFVSEALEQQENAVAGVNRATHDTRQTAERIAGSLQEIAVLARRSEEAASDVGGASYAVETIANRLQVAVTNLKRDLAA